MAQIHITGSTSDFYRTLLLFRHIPSGICDDTGCVDTAAPVDCWQPCKHLPILALLTLKGQCHEIFYFWFFSWISFSQALEYTSRAVSNFSENSRRYSQLKVDHRCQRHRWQTMRLISGWGYLTVNLKAKIYIYVNSTIQRCSNKIIKIFLIEDFFICHRCQRHRWSTLSCEYLHDFWKKFETVLMGYCGAGGKLIHKKTRSKKSRDTVPLSMGHRRKTTPTWIILTYISRTEQQCVVTCQKIRVLPP